MNRGPGRPPHQDTLTPAEWEVVHMVRHGMTNRRIAQLRGTTVGGVKFHLENVRATLHLGDRREIRQWSGLPADHQRRRRTLTTTHSAPTKLNHIGQIAISVADIERSVAFYRDVLGLPYLFTAGQLAFFDCDGTRLFLDALPEAQGNGNSCVYFTVEDIHAAQDELASRGVPFDGAPHLIHRDQSGAELWMTFFRDPDGNILSLMVDLPPAP